MEQDFLKTNDFIVNILRRKNQRNLNLTVKPNGLVLLTVAKTTATHIIQTFVNQKSSWILKHLQKFEKIRENNKVKTYLEGESFPFLGKFFKLHFINEEYNIKQNFKKLNEVFISNEKLIVVCDYLYDSADTVQPIQIVQNKILYFYQQQAYIILNQRLETYSDIMNLKPKKVIFRNQKTRWGSCNSLGSLSLNWRLIAFPLEVIDYVIIHELAHIRYLNHSKKFHDLVKSYCSHCIEARKWLNKNSFIADFLNSVSGLYNDL